MEYKIVYPILLTFSAPLYMNSNDILNIDKMEFF